MKQKKVGFYKAFTVEGAREAMRLSYAKHRNLGLSSDLSSRDAHEAGLFGALGSRYKVMGLLPPYAFPDVVLWPELIPFLMMDEDDAIEYLAEYIVWQQKPHKSRTKWLSEELNRIINEDLSQDDSEFLSVALSLVANRYRWLEIIDPQLLNRILKKAEEDADKR
jgi:hypothetical protein